MPLSKDQILANLDAERPETIRALLDLHHQIFGGFVMKDDGGDQDKDGGDDSDKDSGEGDKDNDADLGEAGKKAIKSERDARKALERKVAELEANRVDPKKLAEALGITTTDDKSSAADVTTALQQRIDTMEQEIRLYRIAAKHKITDEDDLDILEGITDESAMDKIAARLASATRDGNDQDKKRRPRPDGSQGRGNDGNGNRPSSVAEVREARRAEREAKTK